MLAVLSLLNDDVRGHLYRFVRHNLPPITREEGARAMGISAKLAGFHLDKMVQGGLLQAGFDTPDGLRRRVGRAPKLYRPSDLELSLSVPQRRYDLIGEILVDALGHANGSGAETAQEVPSSEDNTSGPDVEIRRARDGQDGNAPAARHVLCWKGWGSSRPTPTARWCYGTVRSRL